MKRKRLVAESPLRRLLVGRAGSPQIRVRRITKSMDSKWFLGPVRI